MAAETMSTESHFAALRQAMVAEVAAEADLLAGAIGRAQFDARVLDALAQVPRHEFVPGDVQRLAYVNTPLPIGHGKTISQPFIVALMSELLDVQPGHRVLEIGTGLGYHAAILTRLAGPLCSVELIPELARGAERRLRRLAYAEVAIKVGNGRLGWPERGPFDRIIVTAAPDLIPPALLQQLAPGGRMVIPCGIPDRQALVLVERDEAGRTTTREVLAVRFAELEEDTGPVGTG
jgi:protein-L-isoaspartate(D-aspartate) O-methyltransferase